MTDAEAAEVIRRYLAGAPVRILAEDTGVNPRTIRTYLARERVPMRRQGRIPGPVQGLYAAAELLRTELSGCTPAEAADALERRARSATTPTHPKETT